MDAVFWVSFLSITAFFALWALLSHRRREAALQRRIRAGYGAPPRSGAVRADTPDVWRAVLQLKPPAVCVDDLTWADLGMDDVYARVNACQSAVGADWLYAVLHSPADPQTLAERTLLQEIFRRDEALRFSVQLHFAHLGRRGGGYALFLLQPSCAALARPWLYRVCAALPWCCLPFLPFGLGAAGCFVGAVCLNIALSTHAKMHTGAYLPALGYVAALLETARRVSAQAQAAAPALSERLRRALAPFKPISGALARVTGAPSLGDAGTLLEALGMATLLPVLYYQRAVRLLAQRPDALLEMCAALGEAELAITAASFCASLPGWCRPVFEPEGQAPAIACEALYHPLVDDPVKNSGAFSRGTLFTGSNASGKSTFLKALAVNALFAQTLHLCTAAAFRLPRAPVITSMAVADDLLAGDSYFIAEIKSLRRVLTQAAQGGVCLCFVDEILKGTNTPERIAASCAVLRYLAKTRCLCFVATHDVELTRLLAETFDNRHFTETVDEGGVHFDYRLRPGPSASRNAIALLGALDFPPDVTRQAAALARAFDCTGRWPADGRGARPRPEDTPF